MTDDAPTTSSEQDRAVSAAQAGDEWGFSFLFDALAGELERFCRNRGSTDSEGSANTILFSAFQAIDRFEGGYREFRAYCYRISRNHLIDEYRRADRQLAIVPLDGVGEQHGVEAPETDVIASDEVRRLLSTLTEDQSDVLLLRILADLSLQETADILQKPVGAIKSLQLRAVRALHRTMASEVHHD